MGDGFGTGFVALIVDDEPAIRTFLQLVLEEEGFAVHTAGGVEQAIATAGQHAIDLALVDKNLDDGSGLNVVRHLRRAQPACELVMVTSQANLESALEAIRLGVADYIEKPFHDIDTLRVRLNRVLDTRALKQQNRRLIQTLKERNEQLEAMAVRDPLTNLFNHAFLQESLEREIHRSKRHNLELGLLFIDLDKFKNVNDTLGHSAGDRLLKLFAEILQGRSRRSDVSFRLRTQDIAARYGGDEFAIILPETPKLGASRKAELLRAFVATYDFAGEGLATQTISVGVAAYPNDADDRGGVVDAADKALYAAKHAGRNRIVAYSPALVEDDAHHPHLSPAEESRVAALKEAIATTAFDFVYQPVLRTDEEPPAVVAYEALCRPRHSAFADPTSLIHTAESVGQVCALGRVLRAGSIEALPHLPEGADLFINLHPHELNDVQLGRSEPELAQNALHVVFDLAASTFERSAEHARQAVQRLREAGFRFALDGEGARYLGVLMDIEPSFVKLHMPWVRRAASEPRVARMLRYAIELAQDSSLQLIGTGVETEADRKQLADLGCTWMQGFFFSPGVILGEPPRVTAASL